MLVAALVLALVAFVALVTYVLTTGEWALYFVFIAAGVVIVTQQLGSQVGRYPSVFAPIDPSTRPADAAGQTFLLIGTDSRSPEPTTGTDTTSGVPSSTMTPSTTGPVTFAPPSTTPPPAAQQNYPVCSRTVKDSCRNPGGK